MTTMGRWFSPALVVLSLRPRGEHLVLPSRLLRWLVRSLAGTAAPSSVPSFPPPRHVVFSSARSVQVGARRGIQAVIRFVRARTPAFPIDRSNGTLPHPRFQHRSASSSSLPVYTLSLVSFTFSCASSSSNSSPFRLRWIPLVLLTSTLPCLSPSLSPSIRALRFPWRFSASFYFLDFRPLKYRTLLFLPL